MFWNLPGQLLVSSNSIVELVQREHSTVVPSWSRTFLSDDYCWGVGAIERDDGSIIVLGNSRVINDYWNYSLWLWCLDSDCVLLWNQCVPASNFRRADSILRSDDGGCFVAGSQGMGENSSTFVFRFDPLGQMVWNSTMSWSDSRSVSDACLLPDGELILAGDCYDPNYSFQSWALKMTDAGDIVWNRTYKPYPSMGSDVISAVPSTQGGVLLVGEILDSSYGYGLAMQLNLNGDLVWVWKNEDRNSAFYDVQECENGDLLFVGYYYSSFLATDGQILAVRTKGDTTQIWKETYSIPFFGWAASLEKLDAVTYIIGTNEAGNYQVGFLFLDGDGGIIYGLEPNYDSTFLRDMIQCQDGDILTVGSQGTAMWIARWQREKAPTPPILSIQAVEALAGDVLLTWLPSQDSDGYVTYYQLEMASRVYYYYTTTEFTVTNTITKLTNLDDGWYWFRVRAIDDLGGISQWSNDVVLSLNRTIALQFTLGRISIGFICGAAITITLYTGIQMRKHRT